MHMHPYQHPRAPPKFGGSFPQNNDDCATFPATTEKPQAEFQRGEFGCVIIGVYINHGEC